MKANDDASFLKVPLEWFSPLHLVAKLLLFFGCLLLLSGLFGLIPAHTIFAVRLVCFGLAWDYFFRRPLWGGNRTEYQDGTVDKRNWVEWPRIIGGIFFLAAALLPSNYVIWAFQRLNR